MSATYDVLLIPPPADTWLSRVMRGFRRMIGRDNPNLALEAISALLKPTQAQLTVGILADDAELVQRCLEAGLKPRPKDLQYLVTPQRTAMNGLERTYTYRTAVLELLRAHVDANPELADLFKQKLAAICGAGDRGFTRPTVIGAEATAALFPGVEVPAAKATTYLPWTQAKHMRRGSGLGGEDATLESLNEQQQAAIAKEESKSPSQSV